MSYPSGTASGFRSAALAGGFLITVFGGVGVWAQAPDLRLIDAVRAERSEAAEALLAETDVNATQADGATALHWAAYLDNETMAARLVAAGAVPGAENDLGATPLTLACENANPAMVELLLKAGADR